MPNKSHLRVSNPPSKPLLIWDGNCDFCRLWIERWREMTASKIDYATYQEEAARFPEISSDEFDRSLVLLRPDGTALFAAEAVYQSLAYRQSGRWLAWSYDHLPGFAAASESSYRFIARHRTLASTITRLLWGKNVRRPTYAWAQRWFLHLLGMIYFVAFASLWVQVDGLIGSKGISPVGQFLPAVWAQLGPEAYSLLPTLCWFGRSDVFVHFLCGSGAVLSLVLILRIAPALTLLALFALYLSLTLAGQIFFSFQWDVLLLETGFLSIFLAPWHFWPRKHASRQASTVPAAASVPRVGLFLLKYLLFKLMLMSGVVKLTSGDDTWWNLTTLDYHYWSQPLPTVFGWWADKSPEWFKHFSVGFCLVVEIIVPFFIWAPRRLRLIAAGLLILLQSAIAITGNYCFFNLLTIALCLLLIDDSAISRQHRPVREQHAGAPGPAPLLQRFRAYSGLVVLIVTLPINTWLIFSAFGSWSRPPRLVANLYERLEAFRIVNGYGLFRVMTKDRCEIVLQGSADGIEWLPYEFRWKPGDVERPPGWCAPHQPRLDWQMWFAALGTPRENPWFVSLIYRLLQGSNYVSRLFADNPFQDKPPHYIRAVFYRYRFTTAEEHRQTGAWWKREELREYLPTVSLEQFR